MKDRNLKSDRGGLRLLPGVFACLLGGALASPPPAPAAEPLAGRWHAGQSWRVEYLRPMASAKAASSAPEPPPQHSVWRYDVASLGPEFILVRVTEEGGDGRFELRFAPAPLNLRRVTRISGNRQSDVIVHATPDPYFGWSASYPLIFDWPALPGTRERVRREFKNDDGQRVEQSIRFTGPSQFDVVMTLRRKVDAGFIETQRSTQTWNEGSAWWSAASIRTERSIDGKTSDQISIRGKLMP